MFKVLEIKQYEGDLYIITFKSESEKVEFSGVFQLIEGIDPKKITEVQNGLNIKIH